MYSISFKYSFPIDSRISDDSLLKYMHEITEDELLSIFKVYSSSYEDGGNFVSVVSEFTNLISFLEKEQQVSQDSLNRNLKNLIDVNVSISNKKVHDYIFKYLNGLVDLGNIHQMAPKPEYMFEDILKKGVTLPDNVLQLTEFIEFILFATTNFRKVSGKPSKFSDIVIPASNEFHLFLDQRQIILYQVHIDVLKNISLHFIENPDAGLPFYFYEMESKAGESNFETTSLGRKPDNHFTKEKVREYVDEFLEDHSYPKPQKFWHIGGVQDGAIVKSELAEYILFEKFKATEDEFSLKSIESRIEEVIPKKYLPSYRKKVNRKKKK